MNVKKRILGIFLIVSMVIGIIPVQSVFTVNSKSIAVYGTEDYIHAGSCYEMQASGEGEISAQSQPAILWSVKDGLQTMMNMLPNASAITQDISLLSATSDAWAQNIVDHTEIEDLNFAKVIAESMEAFGGYTDADFAPDAITSTLQNFSGEINAANRGITSIKGIGLLLNISRNLNINNNQITDVQPLSGVAFQNPDFRRVSFLGNPIVNYPSVGYITPGVQNCDGFWGARWNGSASYLYGTIATHHIPHTKTTDYVVSWETPPALILNAQYKEPLSFTDDINRSTVTVKNDMTYRIRAESTPMLNKKDWGNSIDQQTYSVYYTIANSFYAPVTQTGTAKVVGGIKFTKVNANGDVLQGATYELLKDGNPAMDADGNPAPNKITDANGVAMWDNLDLGDYVIREVIAPAGYTVDPTPVTVTVTGAGLNNAIVGGHKSININATEDTLLPDIVGFSGKIGTLTAQTQTTALNAGNDMTYIRNKGATITALINEVIPADSHKVTVKSANLTLSMDGQTTNPTSLEAAKDAINARVTAGTLNENDADISLGGNVVYQMTEEFYNTPSDTLTKPDGTILTGVIQDQPQPVYVPLTATKEFVGGALTGNDFTFTLSGANDANGTVNQTKTNTADGKITFDTLKFDSIGTYTYTLAETQGTDSLTSYDTASRTVQITVSEAVEAQGSGLKAIVSVDGTAVAAVYSSGTTRADGTQQSVLTPVELTTFKNSKKKSIWGHNTTGNSPHTGNMGTGQGGTLRVINGDDSNDTENGDIDTGNHENGRDYGCTTVVGAPKPGWHVVKEDITIGQKMGNTPGDTLTIVELPSYNDTDGTFSFVADNGITITGKLTIGTDGVATVEITNPEGLLVDLDIGIPFFRPTEPTNPSVPGTQDTPMTSGSLTVTDKTSGQTLEHAPQTGDDSNLNLRLILIGFSLTGILLPCYLLLKKKMQDKGRKIK